MSFSQQSQGHERILNNADSFAISFDATWKNKTLSQGEDALSKDEKLKVVLKALEDHPFVQSYPFEAKQVANFRIKLLNLS